MERTLNKILSNNKILIICIFFVPVFIFDNLIKVNKDDAAHFSDDVTCAEPGEFLDQNHIPEIPRDMFEFIDNLVSQDDFQFTCQTERVNFVYGKTHKCASDTLAAVWRRFALSRNLSVVIPILGKFLLGWPHRFQYYMHRPAKHEWGYNILLDHVVFNYSYISQIMPADAVYFTTVREPFGRLPSALNYHGMGKCGHMPPGVDIGEEFLKDMFWYDNLYKSPDNMLNLTGCKCVPKGISVARNAMAFDLGFPTGWHFDSVDQQNNYTFIKQWLVHMDDVFDMLLPVERFNEAMVLLKRYMCWSFKDIVFRKLRVGKKERKVEFPEWQKHMFRKWSNVDTLLYYMANKTFDRRVKPLGDDFQAEVQEYIKQETEVLDFCELQAKPGDALNVPETKWDRGYSMTYEDCSLLLDKKHNRDRLKEHYDNMDGNYSSFPMELGLNLGTYC